MNIKQGGLENLILNALWSLEESGHFANDVSKVQEKTNNAKKRWAYTTIKTVLDRLEEKKALIRYKQGKRFFYRTEISRKEAGRIAVKNLLKQYFNDDMSEFRNMVEKIHEESLVCSG